MENRIIDAMQVAKRLIGDYLGVKPHEEVFIAVETAYLLPIIVLLCRDVTHTAVGVSENNRVLEGRYFVGE